MGNSNSTTLTTVSTWNSKPIMIDTDGDVWHYKDDGSKYGHMRKFTEWKWDCGGHKADYATFYYYRSTMGQALMVMAKKMENNHISHQELMTWNEFHGAVLQLPFKRR